MATVMRLLEDPTVEPDYRPEASGREQAGTWPIYSAVLASSGRRYLSDEYHHRVIVEEPTGERWSFGGYGTGPGEFNRPRGLVLQEGQDPSASRLFVCDAWNHRLQVFDGDGQWLRMFGTVGSGEGQFDVPSDVTIVPLPGSLGDEGAAGAQRMLLAVADRWNSRIHVSDTAGRFVAVVGGHDRYAAVVPPDRQGAPRAGWPFFRVGLDPAVWYPTRLVWQAPNLLVLCADGRLLRIDLAVAILPDFDAWRQRASITDLHAAQQHFRRLQPPPRVLPTAILNQIDTDLRHALVALRAARIAQGALSGPGWSAGEAILPTPPPPSAVADLARSAATPPIG
jgi:hypothetical protein